jgi:hypothetical protein
MRMCHEAQHTGGTHSVVAQQPSMRMLNMSTHYRYGLLSEQEIGGGGEVFNMYFSYVET